MRPLPLVLVFTAACSKELVGPIPGVYPIVAAPDLDVEACEEAHTLAFEFTVDAQIVARGDREARLIETWKMASQDESYLWDLDSSECTVTIPPVDAEPNFPSWVCSLGDSPAEYVIEDEDEKKHRATATREMRIEGAWVAEDLIELASIETVVECVSGDCDFFDDWIDNEDYILPCDNRYGYRATWQPEE